MQRPCVGAESRGHLVIPASQPSSHPYLNLPSQKRLQTSWKWDKAFYCTVTEFQTHSVHEHDKMVLCYHICDGLLLSKDGIPCLSHIRSLSGAPPCARIYAGHYGHGGYDTIPAHLAGTRHVDWCVSIPCGRMALEAEPCSARRQGLGWGGLWSGLESI